MLKPETLGMTLIHIPGLSMEPLIFCFTITFSRIGNKIHMISYLKSSYQISQLHAKNYIPAIFKKLDEAAQWLPILC